MSKLFVAALGVVLLVGVGCQKDGGADVETTTTTTERSSTMQGADDCTHCAGVQTARADGTCPQCGMRVRTSTTTTP